VARVGEVQAYAGNTPTILEHLLYWISSSMHEPGTYHRPEVPETHIKQGLIPETLHRGFAVAYDSGHDQSDTESTWGGKDDDLQSGRSFSAQSDISHVDSARTVTYHPSRARQSFEPRDWLIACEEAWEGETPSERPSIDDATSEATSQWSSLSVSTVRAGHWINPAPVPLRQTPTSSLRRAL